jgi:uncharacterized membrane protein
MMVRRLSAGALAPLLVIVLATACTPPPRPLGPFEGPTYVEDVNASGVVVGWTRRAVGYSSGWRADNERPIEEVDRIGGPTTAVAINRHGVIVGLNGGYGTVWYPDGRTFTVPSPYPGVPPERAPFTVEDGNDQGLVVGQAVIIGAGVPFPAVWNPATGLSTLLPTPVCDECGGFTPRPGTAKAVNNVGQIVGFIWNPDIRAVVWNPIGWGVWGSPQLLPTIDGSTYSMPYDINDLGTVVGVVTRPEPGSMPPGVSMPAVWRTPAYELTVLPTPEGGSGGASSINASGVVVGTAWPPGRGSVAFRWKAGDPMVTELPGLGDDNNTAAAAINDAGVIVGQGTPVTDPYNPRPVRWDPVAGPPGPPRRIGS